MCGPVHEKAKDPLHLEDAVNVLLVRSMQLLCIHVLKLHVRGPADDIEKALAWSSGRTMVEARVLERSIDAIPLYLCTRKICILIHDKARDPLHLEDAMNVLLVRSMQFLCTHVLNLHVRGPADDVGHL